MGAWLQHRGKRQLHRLMALSLFHNEVYTKEEELHNNRMIEKEEDHSGLVRMTKQRLVGSEAKFSRPLLSWFFGLQNSTGTSKSQT